MRMCLACMNSIMVKGDKLLESDVRTKLLCCEYCKAMQPCVIAIRPTGISKIDQDIYREYERKDILKWIDRWDDPDFQEEKARIREEAGLPSRYKRNENPYE